MDKKHVLMLITNYGFGGAQKVFADHSILFEGKAVVEECVFNDWDQKRVNNTPNSYKSLDVAGGGMILKRTYHFFLRIHRFRKLKKKFKPDITISHLEGADYVNLLSGGNDKKIIVIHGSKVGDKNIAGAVGWLRHKFLIPWLYKKADKIITVSKGIKDELNEVFRLPEGKVVAVPNYFNCYEINQRSAGTIKDNFLPLFAGKTFKLITYARLSAQKNLKALFPVLGKLKSMGYDVQLYIIGDGELKDELLNESRQFGKVWTVWDNKPETPDADIFFLGYHANPHVFLKHADLYVMSSLWEGFPMALCEAMACKIPTISSDCKTGPREIFDADAQNIRYGITKYGALLPTIPDTNDENVIAEWAATIAALMQDRRQLQNIAENAWNRVQDYDESVMGQRWLNEYLS